MIMDDATNTTWAQLGEQETIWAVADALRAWIERYGVPLALYVDWKNLYKRPATPGERLRGESRSQTVWPHVREVKNRGDRRQFRAGEGARGAGSMARIRDRLVKKLRRKEIRSHEHANVYLDYLSEHNQRFARRPPGRRTITVARRALPNWTGVFRSRANARRARTGWCATTTGFFSSRRRVAITRQLRGKCWYAKGGTATSPSSIEAARRAAGRTPHPASRVWRSNGPVGQFRRRPKGSVCRQRITRGERPLAERWRSECPRGPSQRGRCRPSAALNARLFGLRRAALRTRPTNRGIA